MQNIIYTFTDSEFEKKFIGPINQNINLINTELKLDISHINANLVGEDDQDYQVLNYVIKTLETLFNANFDFNIRDIIHIINIFKTSSNRIESMNAIVSFYENKTTILNTYDGNRIIAKTLMQKEYIRLLNNSSVLFVTGSAGTGKTYLATAYAVDQLKKNKIKKIIITRPAVEAGEKLGFLPGDLKEKVDPYLIPIYDCLYEFMGKEQVEKLIEKGTIEIAPLAYMRGRTLDNAMIILDEAQNTTGTQLKMFLTRLGFNSKMVITGDLTQIDLPIGSKSGLLDATNILKGIKGIEHLHFSKYDVMRHPLVTKILERYGDE